VEGKIGFVSVSLSVRGRTALRRARPPFFCMKLPRLEPLSSLFFSSSNDAQARDPPLLFPSLSHTHNKLSRTTPTHSQIGLHNASRDP
jgi:hypothetical protein